MMEREEPALVPQWYKGAGGAGWNRQTNSSSQSDEHGTGQPLLSRNRLPASPCDRDAPRSSAFVNRGSSSLRRSASTNESLSNANNGSAHSRPYSSFGRSHRDRDRERNPPSLHGRDNRPILLENGFCDHSDSHGSNRTLRRSHSLVSGRLGHSQPKGPEKDLNTGPHSGGSTVRGIGKGSFERAFPSLGVDDNQGRSDVRRVSSPRTSTAIQSVSASTVVGREGPVKVGGNGPGLSSALQTAALSRASAALSTVGGLNMAEALVKTPSVMRNTPQISVDTQRIEELTRIQYSKLIPITPSMTKNSVLNSSDKSKSKVAKGGGSSALGQPHMAARSDISKALQSGTFQVLGQGRNGISSAAKDGPSLTNASRVANPLNSNSSAVVAPPLRSPISPKGKTDCKGGVSAPKRSQNRNNRNEFFNSIRKSSANHSAAAHEQTSIPPSDPEKPSQEKENSVLNPSPECCGEKWNTDCDARQEPGKENPAFNSALENGNATMRGCDGFQDPTKENPILSSNRERSADSLIAAMRGCCACQEPGKSVPGDVGTSSCSETVVSPDEEEAAFLRLLGWEEDGWEEPLTAKEIADFVKKYRNGDHLQSYPVESCGRCRCHAGVTGGH